MGAPLELAGRLALHCGGPAWKIPGERCVGAEHVYPYDAYRKQGVRWHEGLRDTVASG